jgi:hypothetical protein
MRKKKNLRAVAKPEGFGEVLKRVSERKVAPDMVTNEKIEEGAILMLERATDHAAKGGARGIYPGENLRTPVVLMIDPSKGYVESNVEVVQLGTSILYEFGFSFEDIVDFIGRKPTTISD